MYVEQKQQFKGGILNKCCIVKRSYFLFLGKSSNVDSFHFHRAVCHVTHSEARWPVRTLSVFPNLVIIWGYIRNVLRRLYSTMLLHFSPLKFPKSVTKLQIPFMFTSFCLSKFNHNKCSKLFLDKLILNLNCFKRANIDIFCLNLLFITMYISIINNK